MLRTPNIDLYTPSIEILQQNHQLLINTHSITQNYSTPNYSVHKNTICKNKPR